MSDNSNFIHNDKDNAKVSRSTKTTNEGGNNILKCKNIQKNRKDFKVKKKTSGKVREKTKM